MWDRPAPVASVARQDSGGKGDFRSCGSWICPQNRANRSLMVALGWLFPDPVPAWLSWAGFWLGVVALVVSLASLPTALQMFFGRPKIEIEFDSDSIEGVHRLRCYIYNRGIKSKLLRRLGVVRTPVEISASASVSEYGTNKMLVSLLRVILTTDKESGLHVELPFSILPARFNIVGYTEDKGAFIISQDDDPNYLALDRSAYRVKIDVITAHQDLITEIRHITVGNGHPYWTTNVN
jgi:hypothetical protein